MTAAASVALNPLAATKGIVKGAADAVFHPVKTAKGAVQGVKTAVKECAKDKATCAGKIAFTAAAAAVTAGAASGAGTGLANAAKSAAELGVKGVVNAGVTVVKNAAANIAQLGVKGVATKVVQGAKSLGTYAVNKGKAFVKDKVDDVVREVTRIKNGVQAVGNAVVDGVAKGKAIVTEGLNRAKFAGKALTDKTYTDANGNVVKNTLTAQQRMIKAKQNLTGEHEAGKTMVCTLQTYILFYLVLHQTRWCTFVPKMR